MEQNTRRNLIARLKELRSAFQVDDPFFTSTKVLSNIDHSDIKKIVPEDSKFAFHSWVNHVFQEIVGITPTFAYYSSDKIVRLAT